MLQCKILSGISGSGKTTWAKEHFREDPSSYVSFSADSFFMKNGKYSFDGTKLDQAHQKCFQGFIEEVQVGSKAWYGDAKFRVNSSIPVLVVDNTNLSIEEIAPYYSVAHTYGYEVELITFHVSPELACKRSQHGLGRKELDVQLDKLSKRNIPSFWKLKQTHYYWEAETNYVLKHRLEGRLSIPAQI